LALTGQMATRSRLRRRSVLWASAVAVMGLLCLAVFRFWFQLPEGAGPAGPAVPRERFTQTWTTRSVLMVGIGDSVTAGLGARKRYSYFDRLIVNPPGEWPDMIGLCLSAVIPNLKTTNLAISGSSSLDHVRIVLSRLPHADSNTLGLVVMTTGGNELIHNYGQTPPREGAMYGATWEQAQPWVRNFEQRLESVLSDISTHFPGGCHIFLADIYDPTDGVGSARQVGLPAWPDGLRILAAYNEIIQRAAARRNYVHLVNMRDPFLGHGLFCTQFWRSHYRPADPHYWYYVNLEDPNERGYDAIRRLFLNRMGEVFSPPSAGLPEARSERIAIY